MPKYWGKQIFAHGTFPEVGQKQKKERKRERAKERKLVITMAKLCMAHASTHGARKPPGPKPNPRYLHMATSILKYQSPWKDQHSLLLLPSFRLYSRFQSCLWDKKKSTRMEILHLLIKVNLSGLYSLLPICSLKPDSLRNTLVLRKLQLTMQG